MSKWKNKLRELCSIDIRSLALFRIGLGSILIYDLLNRLQDLKAHYSDEGILPRSALLDNVLGQWDWSIHLISGSPYVQFLLFVVSMIFACALLVGYKTRIATIVSWILLSSLHLRNPMVLQGGDTLLKMLLFWGMFLPLGACFSLDQKIVKREKLHTQLCSVASLAALLQIAFVYWVTALLKTDESWRVTGDAVWYALSIEQYSKDFGIYLLQFPDLLKFLTFTTLYLEFFGPFLAFSLIWTGPLRFLTFLLFAFFHLVGLNFAMELAHFGYVCTVGWMLFIPRWFWDKILDSKEWQNESFLKGSRFANIVAAVSLSAIALWNIYTLEQKPIPGPISTINLALHTDQYWNMFAPYPLKEDGWYVVPAVLRDGTIVDLYTEGKPISFEKPKLLSSTYVNDRWRSYLMNMFMEENASMYLLHYARYLTKEWNENHPYEKQALSFEIIYMWKLNDIRSPNNKPQKIKLWQHTCFTTD